MVALFLMAVWSFLVIVAVLSVRSMAFADVGFAIDFAAMTNASLVLVAPVNLSGEFERGSLIVLSTALLL